jgi:hypothetical protein
VLELKGEIYLVDDPEALALLKKRFSLESRPFVCDSCGVGEPFGFLTFEGRIGDAGFPEEPICWRCWERMPEAGG